jgi:arylamine N-acetyltransferase
VLGVAAAPPAPEHLAELVRAQLMRVPFENISKLYLRKRRGHRFMPELELHLDGIERHNFGGTCYPNNSYFNLLLRHLGYDVSLCGADMSDPDVHIVSVVRLAGREYLVDVGYAAPFYEPLPRDLQAEHVVRFGRHSYVLHPRDELGRSRMDHLRDGERIHGYTAKPEPREVGFFEKVIADSYDDTASFMNAVVVERFFEDRSLRIHNLKMIESTPDSSTETRLADRHELIGAVERYAGIPADIVRDAIEDLGLSGDIYT